MTRLVVHAGTHATDWPAARQQLVASRAELAAAGVRLSPGDDADAWTALARELTSGRPAPAVTAAVRDVVRDGADALVVGSDQLEDALHDPVAVGNLAALAVELGTPLTVVLVLRDQIGYLNELYGERVLALQTARSFAAFTAEPQPAARFDYATALEPLLRSNGVTLAAIPYSSVPGAAQARELLRAAAMSPAAVDAVRTGSSPPEPTGPILVAAHRLLYKRAWRLGLVKSLPRPRLLGAARTLRQHAAEKGWDSAKFWGWTSGAREEAIARYQAGNDSVALELWNRPWGDDWSTGTYAEADLAASPPHVVVDVLDVVDTLVRDLQRTKGAAPANAAAG